MKPIHIILMSALLTLAACAKMGRDEASGAGRMTSVTSAPRGPEPRAPIVPNTGNAPLTLGAPQASGGGLDSGGGDPLAAQFIQIGRFWLIAQKQNLISNLSVSEEGLKRKLDELEKSLEGRSPRVIFPEGRSLDCLGAPKLGCFKEGQILFAREGWIQADLATKIEVAVMELMMALGLKDRYVRARQVAEVLAPRLILTDGRVRLPRSTDEVARGVVRALNGKGDELRRRVLTSRAETCVALSETCGRYEEHAQKDDYVFTVEKDIGAIVPSGKSQSADPCKEKCDGFEEEGRDFLVMIRREARSRWSEGEALIVLEARYVRMTNQVTGEVKHRFVLSEYTAGRLNEEPPAATPAGATSAGAPTGAATAPTGLSNLSASSSHSR